MVTTSPTVYSHLCTYTSILEADTKPWIKIECNYHTLYINITQIHTESTAITLPSRTKHRAISIYVSKISLIQFLQYWIAFSEWKNGKDYLPIHSSHPSFRYCIAFLFALIWISALEFVFFVFCSHSMLIETYFWLEKRLASFRISTVVVSHTKKDINFPKWKKFCKSFILAVYPNGNNKLLKCVSNCIFERFGALGRSCLCVFMLVSKVRNPFSIFIYTGCVCSTISTTIHSFMAKKEHNEWSQFMSGSLEMQNLLHIRLLSIIKYSCSFICCGLWIVNWKWIEHSIDAVDIVPLNLCMQVVVTWIM